VELGGTGAAASTWGSALAGHAVVVGIWNSRSVRLVTHRHIDDNDAAQTIAAFHTVDWPLRQRRPHRV